MLETRNTIAMLGPTEEAYANPSLLLAPSAVRVVEDDASDLVLIELLDGMDRRWIKAHAKLTKRQLHVLHDLISDYLGSDEYERGYSDGYEQSEGASWAEGYDAGYEAGRAEVIEGFTEGLTDWAEEVAA